MKAKLIKKDDGYYLTDIISGWWVGDTDHKKVKEHKGEQILSKLSLKNCQAIERGYDLDELFDEEVSKSKSDDFYECCHNSFIKGFQKALEFMGDKKFTEDDMMLSWDAGVMSQSICASNYFGLKRQEQLKQHRDSYKENLKPISLQQNEWDVEIEMTLAPKYYGYVPKLDADGCLILKRADESDKNK